MRPFRFLGLFFGALVMGLGASACAASGAHGYPVSGRTAYSYVYYPEYQLYYAPDRHVWFWPSGNVWHSGPQLPRIFHPHVRRGGITVQLFDRHPRGHHHRPAYPSGSDRYGYWYGQGYHPRQHGWKDPQTLRGWKDHPREHRRRHDDGRYDAGHGYRHDDRRHGHGRDDRRDDGRHSSRRDEHRHRRD